MAGHHCAGFYGDPSLADALLAERNRLVSSIVSLHPAAGGIHGATIQAVRDLLRRFPDAGIPWVRMYHSFPPWQQRCGLLQENWDRNVVPERAKVIFTLITPMGGGAISRKALGAGGGTWKSTGAEPIGSGEVVLSKLYLKRDDGSRGGLTAFEFRSFELVG